MWKRLQIIAAASVASLKRILTDSLSNLTSEPSALLALEIFHGSRRTASSQTKILTRKFLLTSSRCPPCAISDTRPKPVPIDVPSSLSDIVLVHLCLPSRWDEIA
ncbi:hypothetical protein BDP55DRAFT_419089 [Colletotrichum godetiae]|uniref:Uncharacterized protein n=1 Tax=Colletotrichum godetiae TaxID=1209918 RepID=A0AAJ0AA06_9PEZI|nr:uncharacterized protein BDP55DRAFT_419089 [Colletotrichum godetiae]KAK1657821.1 hypothetical protein BDP55DRAFT_419089 [Colletotrichum godetiae]